jgi:hypothetical protein
MLAKRFSWVAGLSFPRELHRSRLALAGAASLSRMPLAVMLIGVVIGLGAIDVFAKAAIVHGGRGGSNAASENTLIVWAGDKAHVAPDFIAVVDFDEHSSTYG